MTRSKTELHADRTGHKHFQEMNKKLEQLKKKKAEGELSAEENNELVKYHDELTAFLASKGLKEFPKEGVEEPAEKDPGAENDQEPAEDEDADQAAYFEYMIRKTVLKLQEENTIPTADVIMAQLGLEKSSDKPSTEQPGTSAPPAPPAKVAKSADNSASLPQASSSAAPSSIDDLIDSAIPDASEAVVEDTIGMESDMEFLGEYFDMSSGLGEPFSPAIANILKKGLHDELTPEHIKEMDARYLKPSNAEAMIVPRVNSPIWNAPLHNKAKQRDLVLSSIQGMALKAVTPLLREMQVRVEHRDKESARNLSDVLKYIGILYRFANNRRRELLSPDIDPAYRSLCHGKMPVTEWLFGDDLAKQVTDMDATNKLSAVVKVKKEYKPKPKLAPQSYAKFKPKHDRGYYQKRIDFLEKDRPRQHSGGKSSGKNQYKSSYKKPGPSSKK